VAVPRRWPGVAPRAPRASLNLEGKFDLRTCIPNMGALPPWRAREAEMQSANHINVLVLEEDGGFFAQGIEYNIAVQAEDNATLHKRFELTFLLEAQDGLDRIGPAPELYKKIFESGLIQGSESHIDSHTISYLKAA